VVGRYRRGLPRTEKLSVIIYDGGVMQDSGEVQQVCRGFEPLTSYSPEYQRYDEEDQYVTLLVH
jgi:hypothetical protein